MYDYKQRFPNRNILEITEVSLEISYKLDG